MEFKDHKHQTFESQLGATAKVERHEEQSELMARANQVLRDIGENINVIENSEYVGSCAVHVYRPKGTIQYLHFQCQVAPMQDVEEVIASKALTDLKGALMEMYGRKRQVKRSGF